MVKLRRFTLVSQVLGLLSIVAVILSFLALTDIGHGEGDLTLEWWIVRGSFLVIIAFQISALWTISRVIHPNSRSDTP
jgi:uncharacterized membrane protein